MITKTEFIKAINIINKYKDQIENDLVKIKELDPITLIGNFDLNDDIGNLYGPREIGLLGYNTYNKISAYFYLTENDDDKKIEKIKDLSMISLSKFKTSNL